MMINVQLAQQSAKHYQALLKKASISEYINDIYYGKINQKFLNYEKILELRIE